MNFQSITFFLVANGMSLGGLALQAAILLRMHNKKLHRELRMFYAYVAFSLLQSIILFSFLNYFGYFSPQYFFAYWLTSFVDMALTFFIIQEVYAKALYCYEGLRKLSSMIFRWAFMMLAMISIVYALASPAKNTDWMSAAIMLINQSALFVEVGLMVLLFVFARSLSLGWSECVFGIAVGMTFYCSMQLIAVSLRNNYGVAVEDFFIFGKPLISVSTLGVWMGYIYRSERVRKPVLPLQHSNLEAWNQAVLQFLSR
jgi:hypothetical protein